MRWGVDHDTGTTGLVLDVVANLTNLTLSLLQLHLGC